jgi:hypothetical protein
MPVKSRVLRARTLVAAAAASILIVGSGYAQKANPFAKFHGNWVGNGEIHLASGTKELIRCRGEFAAGDMLRVDLKCANPGGMKFELQSDLIFAGGAITGTWTETSRGLNGRVTGKMADDKISAIAEGQTFTARLELTSFGDKQHVVIASPGSEIANVLIGLVRSGARATQSQAPGQ